MAEELSRRYHRFIRFLQNRLSPQGYMGLHLTVGLIVIVLASWWFSEIAEDLGPNEWMVAFDQRVTHWFALHAAPQLTTLARIITFFGSVGFLATASILAVLIFIRQRAWDRLWALALAMIGGSLLNILLKHLFHRQRPLLENPLVTLKSFGFPSGHTMGATLFYELLALFLAQSIRGWSRHVLVFIIAFLIVSLIGVSRIYLGAHYLSDVLAAIAAGIVWLAISWTAVETWRKRRAANR
jgi:membrane-associated phospholipid phosphatase